MFRNSVALLVWIVLALPVSAQITPGIQRLSAALGLPEIIDIMQIEGLSYGDELADNMFPGRNADEWQGVVSRIYDTERMQQIALTGIGDTLSPAEVTALTDFFESQLGVEIIALEISARRALLDDAVDDANRANVAQMIAEEHPRIALLQEFIDVNDLVESNVVGALNSNFAFFAGLVDGGAYPEDVSEDEILSDVWSQEPEIRVDTGEWLFAYLSMAYSPLDDAQLQAYIDFSRTGAGQALNGAVFAGFDVMFVAISRELGLAVAKILSSQEL